MPPKEAASAAAGTQKLSAREQELMSLAWSCFESDPKLNLDKFAKAGNFTNKGSASNAWRNIRNKVGLIKSEDVDGGPPKSAGKKRGKTDEDDGVAEESPSKKSRARKGKGVKTEDIEDAAGGDQQVKEESD